MSESDRLHFGRASSGRPRGRVVALAVVVVLLLLAGALTWWALDRRGGEAAAPPPDPVDNPAAVAPPVGLELPEPAAAEPVAEALWGAAVDPVAVRRALGRLTADRRLGPRVSVQVAGLDGVAVHTEGPALVTPASTLKLVTALAALEELGPEHRFATTTVREGRRVVLVGGGDPLLAAKQPAEADRPADPVADVTTLARRTAARLLAQGRTRVSLGWDDSLFTGPAASPDWEADYVPDAVVTPISALWVDEGLDRDGFGRSATPARDAAAVFSAALARNGVAVTGPPARVRASDTAAELASVVGSELVEVVQEVLETSDNEGAEVLARHVALAQGRPGSFAGGARALVAATERAGVPLAGAVVEDGSGLARGNRLAPQSLLALLALAAGGTAPALSGVTEGLPVAGFTGSLAYRFADGADAGLGRVRAKTGTLTGVHGLAGLVTARDGTVLVFVAVADRVREADTLFARDRLDRVAAALAGCRCGAG